MESLSQSAIEFLNKNLQSIESASSLYTELESQCSQLDQSLLDLNRLLLSHFISHRSFSDHISVFFSDIFSQLDLLDGGVRLEHTLGEELLALAKEVARVESVRIYAETALKLDNLVGEIEDAVASTMDKRIRKNTSSQNLEDTRMLAVKSLNLAEDILFSVTRTRPQWSHLISAVDHRVDRALAVLRPQGIADHRALLSSLGWPPPLSALNSPDIYVKKSSEVQNPLFTMCGDLKQQYCENFISLCSLQELQRRRKSRQLEGHNREIALHQPLWTIEELINPLSIAMQRHFSKWVDKPDFIFALVYKITRDYVDSMDELLQPLVDEARLLGYSCREEWISSMVSSLSTYLAKEIFPLCISQIDEESVTCIQSKGRLSWLHLIDLMVTFDKRVQTLVAQTGILLSLQEDGNLMRISSFSVFGDRPDWLDLWADLELTDMLSKLESNIGDERNWLTIAESAMVSGSEDYKSPAITSVFIPLLSSVVDRSRSLPSISIRSRFVHRVLLPLIRKFLDCLLFRCQEAEGLTALTDDNAIMKVAKSVNAAHHVESVLKEWSEDVFFLEMGLNDESSSSIDDEIEKLFDFRSEWAEKLSTVVLRGFDSRCREYVKNKKQWQETSENNWTISRNFVEALDYLQVKMSILEDSLNRMDFVGAWRNAATGIDRFLFNGIIMSHVKFQDGGVDRFGSDVAVLFGVFGAWCLRPEGFFPRLSESLKMLKMGEKQIKGCLIGGEKRLKEMGIRHLSVNEAERIVKNRVYIK